jgi:hypothetical protein
MARQEEAGHSDPDEPLQHRGLEQDDQKDDDQNDNEDAGSYVHAEPPFGCGHSLTTTHLYRPEFNLKRPIHRDPIELYANCVRGLARVGLRSLPSRPGRPIPSWDATAAVEVEHVGLRTRAIWTESQPYERAAFRLHARLALNLSFGFEDSLALLGLLNALHGRRGQQGPPTRLRPSRRPNQIPVLRKWADERFAGRAS